MLKISVIFGNSNLIEREVAEEIYLVITIRCIDRQKIFIAHTNF